MDDIKKASQRRKDLPPAIKWLTEYPLLIALVALIVVFAVINPRFISQRNVFNIILQVSILAPVAIGMTLVILTGGIDLSVGSVLAFTSAVGAGMMLQGNNILLSCLFAIALGASLGLVSGSIISFLKVPPLIATLGMLSAARGMQLTYTLGATLYSFPPSFRYLGTALWLGIPAPIYLVIAIFIIFILIMKYTTLGRSIYAVGGNAEAARISGISIRKVTLATYSIAGAMVAIGGLLQLMRIDAAETSAGTGLELEAIAAVVIGGTSLSGGRGSVFKTALGTAVYGVILNGLNIIGVNPFFQKIVIGALIVGAVSSIFSSVIVKASAPKIEKNGHKS